MYKQLLAGAALCGLALFYACQQEPPKAKPVVLESLKIEKKDGADCDKPDSLRNNCATVVLAWPSVKEGSEPLKKSVAAWANNFLAGLLVPSDSVTTVVPLETAVQTFIQAHRDWKKEAPEMLGSYYAEASDTVLYNNGKHLTLQIFGEVFMGGAHGNHVVALATFDATSGQKLALTDLVTDTVALKTLLEKTFRTERADLFQASEDGTPGFNFDEVFQFVPPQNYGLTDKGIYFYYVPYEVTPYAFGSTAFVIPFETLGPLFKK